MINVPARLKVLPPTLYYESKEAETDFRMHHERKMEYIQISRETSRAMQIFKKVNYSS
jgi:hypothetical protein